MKKNELKNVNKLSAFKKSSILGPITILIVIMLFLFITTPPFRQAYNITSLMLSAAVYVMVAMGASIVIIGDVYKRQSPHAPGDHWLPDSGAG